MLNDRNLVRGLVLMLIALGFGLPSLHYKLGALSHAGPGLFPFMVSCFLFVIGAVTVIRARLVAPVPLGLQLRNIAIVLASLCAFALVSLYLNMTLGILALVFLAGFGGTSYSVLRNLKISAVLIAIAFALHLLLGVQLPLY